MEIIILHTAKYIIAMMKNIHFLHKNRRKGSSDQSYKRLNMKYRLSEEIQITKARCVITF